MEVTVFAQMLGWVATAIFTFMIVPQMVKTIRIKDIRGVSVWQYYLFGIANIIALIYAILIVQYPLIIKYILALISTIIYVCIFFYFKYKR